MSANAAALQSRGAQRLSTAANLDRLATFADFLYCVETAPRFFPRAGLPPFRSRPRDLVSPAECDDKHRRAHFRATRAATKAVTPEEVAPVRHAISCSTSVISMPRADGRSSFTSARCRGNNTQNARNRIGPDTGFDSIGDFPQAAALGLVSRPPRQQMAICPKSILYNSESREIITSLATMAGNFQDGSMSPARSSSAAGGGFSISSRAMTLQINALSNLGLLRRFVGMLTDSRSFLSYHASRIFPAPALQPARQRCGKGVCCRAT